MQKPDEFRVSFDQNPAVKEAIQNLNNGDKLKLETHATLKQSDAEGATFIAEAYIPEGFEIDDQSETPGEMGMMNPAEANMTPAAMMVRRRRE